MKNPAGFLAACIANRFPVPRDFEEAESRLRRRGKPVMSPKSVEVTSTTALAHSETSALDEELAGFSDSEREQLEAQALIEAKPFVAATYERLKKDGGALFEEVRRSLVVEYLQRQGAAVPEQEVLKAS